MTDDELVILTQPYSNLLTALGGLRDNETITDKQLFRLQRSVISADDDAVQCHLKREGYLSHWNYRLLKRRDKWAYRDAKKKLKADRRAQLKAARFARKKQKVTAPALDTAETATTSP